METCPECNCASYCEKCATCHECLEEHQNDLMNKIANLEVDLQMALSMNACLQAEIESLEEENGELVNRVHSTEEELNELLNGSHLL